MRALVLTAFGGPENFVLKEIPKPVVRPGTLLIKLAATSVNSIDIKIREGALSIAPPLPALLGSDIAGIVEEVGEGVLGFSVGDQVYGCAGGVQRKTPVVQIILNNGSLDFVNIEQEEAGVIPFGVESRS